MDNPLNGLESYQQKLQESKTGNSNRKINTATKSPWVDPVPIEERLLPVPPFPMDILPVPLQPWIEDIAYRKQCPPEYAAIPAMVMMASLIGKGCHIKPLFKDDWRVVPNLWGGVVGDPGTLKTPVWQDALFPFKALERDAFENYQKELEEYNEKMETYLAYKQCIDLKKKKAIKADDKEALESLAAEYKALKATEPKAPSLRRYKVGDITLEKLQELLSINPRGFLLFRDELMGFFVSFEKKGHETDRSFYIEAWDGNSDYPLERIIRGTIMAKEICLSVCGGIQPEKLLAYLRQNINNLANDGFIQRFQLLVYPDRKPWRLTEKVPDSFAQKRIFFISKSIASMDFLAYGATQDAPRYEGEESKPYFRFDPDAQLFFNNWIQKHQAEKLEVGDRGIIVEHLSKYRSLMPSLALIDHIIKVADLKKAQGGVSLESAQKAAAWCDFLEAHARRIYGMALNEDYDTGQQISKAEKFLAWMRKQSGDHNTPLTRRFMLRNSRVRSSKELDPVLSDLMDMGYIEPVNGNAFRILPEKILPSNVNETEPSIL